MVCSKTYRLRDRSRLPWRPWRTVNRRQRFEKGRHRGAIRIAQLRRVLDDTRHRSARGVALRSLAGLEEPGDILFAPAAEALLRDVGHPTLALGIRPARE